MSRPADLVPAAPQASPADNWVSRAAAATVAALAGLAGAISYSHMRQLAQQHGQAGWHAHVFPLSVDGLEIVASLVLLADHRSGRRPGWLPWAALVIGTAGSLAANVATAEVGTVSRIIAGWPALALLIAVKLLAGMLNRPTALSRPGTGQNEDDGAIEPEVLRPIRADHATSAALPGISRLGSRGVDRLQTPPAASGGQSHQISELLPAARAARDELRRDGTRLTRDALATRMRESGHPVRNSRLTPMLQALRSEAVAASPHHHADQAA